MKSVKVTRLRMAMSLCVDLRGTIQSQSQEAKRATRSKKGVGEGSAREVPTVVAGNVGHFVNHRDRLIDNVSRKQLVTCG